MAVDKKKLSLYVYDDIDDPEIIQHGDAILEMYKHLDSEAKTQWKQLVNLELFDCFLNCKSLAERSNLSKIEGTRMVVAFYSGKPIGFAELCRVDRDAGCTWLHLDSLFVNRAYRGYGIGRDIVHHVKLMASADDVDVITLSVNVQNPAAQGFYEAIGLKVATQVMTMNIK